MFRRLLFLAAPCLLALMIRRAALGAAQRPPPAPAGPSRAPAAPANRLTRAAHAP